MARAELYLSYGAPGGEFVKLQEMTHLSNSVSCLRGWDHLRHRPCWQVCLMLYMLRLG